MSDNKLLAILDDYKVAFCLKSTDQLRLLRDHPNTAALHAFADELRSLIIATPLSVDCSISKELLTNFTIFFKTVDHILKYENSPTNRLKLNCVCAMVKIEDLFDKVPLKP